MQYAFSLSRSHSQPICIMSSKRANSAYFNLNVTFISQPSQVVYGACIKFLPLTGKTQKRIGKLSCFIMYDCVYVSVSHAFVHNLVNYYCMLPLK